MTQADDSLTDETVFENGLTVSPATIRLGNQSWATRTIKRVNLFRAGSGDGFIFFGGLIVCVAFISAAMILYGNAFFGLLAALLIFPLFSKAASSWNSYYSTAVGIQTGVMFVQIYAARDETKAQEVKASIERAIAASDTV